MSKTKHSVCLGSFIVKTRIEFNEAQKNALRRQANKFFLDDEECNAMTESGFVPKHPEKETAEYHIISNSIEASLEVGIPVHFFSDGSMRFGEAPPIGPVIAAQGNTVEADSGFIYPSLEELEKEGITRFFSKQAVRDVECPRCGMKKGGYCKTPKGRLAKHTHGERISAYSDYCNSISPTEFKRRHSIDPKLM